MKSNFSLMLILLIAVSIPSCQKQTPLQSASANDAMLQSVTDASSMDSRTASVQRPHINPSDFVDVVDNPYFPLIPGTTQYYTQLEKSGGKIERKDVQIDVTSDTKEILGVTCVVVHDVVKTKGQITEDTYDWYAQDKRGNVWYMGENTKKLIDGNWITTGSWEGGVNGAVPGIIMLGNPEKHIGQIYPQEYLKDSAEDKAKVISVNSTTSIQLGTFSNCVVTEETTPLDPGVIENKYYAKGIGNISTILNVGGAEHEELIKVVHN